MKLLAATPRAGPAAATRFSIVAALTALTLAPIAGVVAHGHMTDPPSRYGTDQGNDDHQRTPINLRPEDFPSTWTTPMTPCGGLLKSQSKISTTSVSAGAEYVVAWEMGYWTGAALHQGFVTVSITTATDDDSGTFTQLGTVSLVGDTTVDTTPHNMTVTIPSSYASGEYLTMQWYWKGSVTSEEYYNCADLVVGSSTAATTTTSSSTSTSSSSSAGSTAAAATTSTTSAAAAAASASTTTSSSERGVTTLTTRAAGITAETKTVTTTTTAAAAAEAASSSSSSSSSTCTAAGKLACDPSTNAVSVCSASGGSWVVLGSLDGSCTAGAYVCVGDQFAQCTAGGAWACMRCATGTACEQTASGSIACAAAVRRRRRSDVDEL